MNEVAAQCKKQKHHPEWSNIYNQTTIRWTTHNPEGLSHRDITMAKFCDEAGKQFGEIVPEPNTSAMKDSSQASDWEKDARDCCGRGKV